MPLSNEVHILQVGPQNPDGVVIPSPSAYGVTTSPGATPISNNLQAAVPSAGIGTFNQSGGAASLTVFNSATTSPSSVATITVAEQSFTMPTVPPMLTTDLIIVNKPTVDAGIGLCMSRVSTTTAIALAFANVTAGTLTPTATQSYLVTSIGTNMLLSATLTPAAVAAGTVVEQTFSVAGVNAGMLINVNKPTTQAGLGVLSARGVSNGVLGITFINPTAGVLTPTAAEVYKVAALPGLVAANQLLQFGIAIGSVTCAANTTAEKILQENTLLGSDIWVGATKPTLQAGIGITGGRVSPTSAAVYVTIVNATAAVVTPTSTELYGVTVYRPIAGAVMSVYTATLAPTSVAANTSAEQTFTVTGLVSGAPVAVSPQYNVSSTVGVGIAGARVSATNTLALCFINATAGAIVPPAGSYLIAQFNVGAPTAGNSVVQQISHINNTLVAETNAIRQALISYGAILGS
jgi:hypothetical protein